MAKLLIKSLILWIRSSRWHLKVLKHNKKYDKIDSKDMSLEEFKKYCLKSWELETKGMKLQRKLDNLK